MKKFLKNSGLMFVLGGFLTFALAAGHAQQTVYKWLDEDGVIHFSDEPPDEALHAEMITTDRSPPRQIPLARPPAKPPAEPSTSGKNNTATPAVDAPAAGKILDITKVSIADLNRRCEDAREKRLAPLREAEIASCKEDKRNDPAWCERFNATYGDGGRSMAGYIRPRMFDDLPECMEASQEQNRRRR